MNTDYLVSVHIIRNHFDINIFRGFIIKSAD